MLESMKKMVAYLFRAEDAFNDPKTPDIQYCRKQSEGVVKYFNEKGKTGLRIATDLTSFFIPRGLYVSLFDLEHLFERRADLPIVLLCAYDATAIPATTDLDIAFFCKKINSEWQKFVDVHSFAIYVSKGKEIIFTV